MPVDWNSVAPLHALVSILGMKKSTEKPPQVERFERGIWKICMVRNPTGRQSVLQNWKDVIAAMPLLKRLILEVYALDPLLTIVYVLGRVLSAIETAIPLYLSSRLLKIIEDGLRKGRPNTFAILKALSVRLIFHIASTISTRAIDRAFPRLQAQVQNHFQLYLMQGKNLSILAQLYTDVATSQETHSYVAAEDGWNTFVGAIQFGSLIVRAWSQFAVVASSSGAKTSRVFALLCFVKPVIKTLAAEPMWHREPHIAYTENESYKRLFALRTMSSEAYRSEIVGGDLANYIIAQYKKSLDVLGDLASETSLSAHYHRRVTLTSPRDIINQLLGFFPTIYSTFCAILDPQFSMSSIAIMQQTSESFERSMDYLILNVRYFSDECQTLKELYEAGKIKNQLKEGTVNYPRSEEEKAKGMSFEIRDLSFSYPGSQSVKPAICNLSLTIKSGQLREIHDPQKSSPVYMTRRHPEESILVDGLPISHYRMADLRQAMAMLTQDHTIFPISLGENIGLGCVEHVSDDTKILKAAELGGATPCLEKLERGKDTVLTLLQSHHASHVPPEADHPLRIELDKLDKSIELSGGERQRIVASRTFMRFESEALKFVAVDEPSSAMDPEAEAALFENLQNHRSGKTMVFVTHRFGHLTKHADLIVCMKDGSVAEAGTHGELIAKNGEYAKLYNIQASAFANASSVAS
ncbi:P-loop containing nucleoside triphosphate hydrolase protein [Desarmillaria tabescens]|uniref:P-loop containing nucleoside triphosphate hydrolase protein n=1 Tax=Armillaria tabescens TaxID=1929756 RepID=A0AA39N322_ARMTA|nr:P-loop containing nucleoside triphosphate hydrolase protein [Desarmillaria tabescens]KAK0455673.1 P-loop containing nucleoside triphosphate hydrolase protein [Desarmillaria tabescens]